VTDFLVLPTGSLVDASLAVARSSLSRSILDHSVRSFLFARLLADEEGALHDADYDEDLLFAATVMHDLGLGDYATAEARFFIDAGRITDAVADRLRQEVFNAYPRPAGDRSIAEAIVAHAARSEAAAPLGSLAFELLRQHRDAESGS
jgi:hypothetical protein